MAAPSDAETGTAVAPATTAASQSPSPEDALEQQAPFVITKWCSQCWPKRRSKLSDPDSECQKSCDAAKRNTDPVVTVLWPPIAADGLVQTNVVVRPPPANFDFSHMQYLPCGYGRQCKYGLTCTRAHSSPPQAEIAYWNYVQPLGAPSRRRRAATQKNLGKDWSLTTLFECKICGVRMNSAAQLTQHHAGSKHRAQAALKSSAGPVPAIVAPPGQPTVLPHGTGPFYTNMAADWSGGSPRGGPTTASAGLVDGMVDLEIAPSVENGFVNDDPMTRTNWAKKQAYITAVKTGDNAEVTRLIKEGVDIDARDSGCPALHWAIFMGRVNTVSLLVKLGARKDLQDLDKQTAVHICVHPRHGMMNQMRRESKTSNVPFNYNEDAVRVLTTLMQGGWSPDARDALGRTGLHHVAEQGNCTLAYVLLQFKANPAIHNNDGYSPTDVATLKAKSEGLTKYVQLRDLLRTSLYDAPGSGAETNPMAIPDSAFIPSPKPTRAAKELGAIGAAPPDGDLAPPLLPPLELPQESAPSDDVDDSFRPLLAALASLSSTRDAFTERGVEVSQLEVRLREVLGSIGVNFTSYLQHAQKAGVVDIREAANGRRHYVSIAQRFSSLVVQPSLSQSSSTLGSTSLSSMIPASQSLQWHRGEPATKGLNGAPKRNVVQPVKDVRNVVRSEESNTGAPSPVDYEALISGVLEQDNETGGMDWPSSENGDASELSKISHSFMFDPFANATHLGPEPLFADSVSYSANEKRSSKTEDKSPWQSSPHDSPWTGIRPNPAGGIPSSLSFADMSLLRPTTLSQASERSPWPPQSGPGCARSDSLPSFGSRPGPPGLSLGGQVNANAKPWVPSKAADWGGGLGSTELSSSIEWLNVASKTTAKPQ